MGSDKKLHVFDEVAKHNKTKDCWLIIDGKYKYDGLDEETLEVDID